MNRLRYLIAWLIYGRRRCDAGYLSPLGLSLMDNALSVYRCKPYLATGVLRCPRPAVAALRVHWGSYVANICVEHAEMLQQDTLFSRNRLPDGTMSEVEGDL